MLMLSSFQPKVISGTLHLLFRYEPVQPMSCLQHITAYTLRALLIIQFSRLARRGGVKRISSTIYGDMRRELKDRLNVVSLPVDALPIHL